jgi:hypothetical protein
MKAACIKENRRCRIAAKRWKADAPIQFDNSLTRHFENESEQILIFVGPL